MVVSKKTFLTAAAAALIALAASGCWDMTNPLRAGHFGPGVPLKVAHSINLGGSMHASGYCQPLVNCSRCHGDTLQGGSFGEPSCTKCHGDNWSGSNCGGIAHTVNLGGHLHAPNYCKPLVNCVACHGQDLRGGSSREPSCYACHGAVWTDCGD